MEIAWVQKVADSLQFWRSVGHPSPTREQVAAVAGQGRLLAQPFRDTPGQYPINRRPGAA